MKTYRGRRTLEGECVVTVQNDDARQEPLRHYVRHSPTGFEWGYEGSGPAELARCILLDYLELPGNTDISLDSPHMQVSYQDFKRKFIARLSQRLEAWELTGEVIEAWIAEQPSRQR